MSDNRSEPETATFPGEADPVSRAWSDMRDRQERGLVFRAEDYLNSSDPFWADPDRVLDLVYAEHQLRSESGDPPGNAEIRERFPNLFDKFMRQLSVHDALEGEVEPEAKLPKSTKKAQSRTETLMAAAGPPRGGQPVVGGLPGIGKYRVITELGKGGQATVYRGFHPDLGRDVVIKISHHSLTPGSENAIRAEGRALAALTHPGIAAVLDFDLHEGRPFLVTEHIDGRSLDKVVAEAPMKPARTAAMMAEIAAAVAAAHGRGLLHLDLKPANILLGRDGRIRVIDFGLARLFATEPRENEPHEVSGTLAYMAPEQAVGDPSLLTPRTDIFGLGGVLYFLLTGYAPYRGTGIDEIFKRILAGDWDRSPLAGCEISSRIRGVCEKALAPKPDDRYASATEFAAALTPCRRMRWAKIGGIVVAAILALIAMGWLWPRSASSVKPVADTPPVRRFAQPVIRIQVFDPDLNRRRDLVYRAASTGDEVRFEVERPLGVYASLFAIDADGSVRVLASAGKDETGGMLGFPTEPNKLTQLTPPSGTMVVLLCGRAKGSITFDEVRAAAGLAPWPTLPPNSIVRVTKDKVEAEGGRGVGPPVSKPDPEGVVLRRLENVRIALGECEVVAGVAFSHR